MAARTPPIKGAKKTGAATPARTGTDAAAAYVAQQPPEKRALLERLRALVVKGLPDATVSLKWGVPVYGRNGKNVCALASFKDHVAINFFAPPEALSDPQRKLDGAGRTSRMLKIRQTGDIDSASILRWLKSAAAAAG